jgi:hypothetical protein
MPAPVPAATFGADGMPSRLLPDKPGDVVKDGLRYRATVAGDTLVAGAIGSAGASTLTLPFRVTSNRVSLGVDCWAPGRAEADVRRLEVRATVSGTKGSIGMTCQTREPEGRDLQAGGWLPGAPSEPGWDELEVGSDATMTVQLVDSLTGQPAQVDGVHLAGAIYNLGSRVYVNEGSGSDGVTLPERIEHQGHTYVLDGEVRRLAMPASHRLTASTPAGTPFLVAYGTGGSTDSTTDPGTSGVTLTGLDASSSEVGLGGWTTVGSPARDSGKVTLEHVGAPASIGFDFIAIYTLAD